MSHLRKLNPRLRRQLALANACLAIGLVMWVCIHPSNATLLNVRDAIVGFLLGLSLAANVLTLFKARRNECGQA